MSNVRIMTDTIACIPPDLVKKYNIKVIPTANILIDGKSYIEGVDFSMEEAYALIRKDPDKFTTSSLTPAGVLNAYQELSRETDNIVFITVSAHMTALNNVGHIAAELLKEDNPKVNVKIVDSRSASSPEGLIVLSAARAAAQGMSLDQVAGIAEESATVTHGIMMLDTLRYVYRTGRIPKIGSQIASWFNIKPVIQFTKEGKLAMVNRARDRAGGLRKMLDAIAATQGKDTALQFMVTHADAPDFAEQACEAIKREFNVQGDIVVYVFSPIMGYSTGPGVLSIGSRPNLTFSRL